MATSYLAPGVYSEEIPAQSMVIEGVSTSTLGMVGPTERGPSEGANLVSSWAEFQSVYGGPLSLDDTYFTHAVKGFFANGGTQLYCARIVGVGAAPAFLDLTTTSGGGAGPTIAVRARGAGQWGNTVFVRVRAATRLPPNVSGFRLTILYFRTDPPRSGNDLAVDPLDLTKSGDRQRREPDVVEDYDYVTTDPTTANDVVSTVNGRSSIVTMEWSAAVAPGTTVDLTGDHVYTALANGTDVALTEADYVGRTASNGTRSGLLALEAIDDIALLAIPDQTHPTLGGGATVVNVLVEQCERLKSRFAILAVPLNQPDVQQIVQSPPTDSSYAAIYYPSIHVVDDVTSAPTYIPAVGHMAGIYARTDGDRGVQKAPANADIRGILIPNTSPTEGPLEFMLSQADRGVLNPHSVCALVDQRSSGRGVRVWGARTLSADPQWRYVQVRRTFIYLEQSIERGTQWVVFEDNVEATWERLKRSIVNFLTPFWRSGGLAGLSVQEAFYVKCDRTTMTQADIDAGRLICEIGVAPVKPAEFVIFRFSQFTLQSIS